MLAGYPALSTLVTARRRRMNAKKSILLGASSNINALSPHSFPLAFLT